MQASLQPVEAAQQETSVAQLDTFLRGSSSETISTSKMTSDSPSCPANGLQLDSNAVGKYSAAIERSIFSDVYRRGREEPFEPERTCNSLLVTCNLQLATCKL